MSCLIRSESAILRDLMDEWEATAEVGWSRSLSIEEARVVLSSYARGVIWQTTADRERKRPSRG